MAASASPSLANSAFARVLAGPAQRRAVDQPVDLGEGPVHLVMLVRRAAPYAHG